MEQVAPGLQKFQDRMCCVLSRSVVSDSTTPWTVACQASLSMGILQARILEWVAMSSSRGSSQPRDRTQVSYTAGGFFTIWATREAHEYWVGSLSLLQLIFLTQELNRGLLHCRQILYQLSYQGNPYDMKNCYLPECQDYLSFSLSSSCSNLVMSLMFPVP